jgi:F-type H+-transporting ATPase subunit c
VQIEHLHRAWCDGDQRSALRSTLFSAALGEPGSTAGEVVGETVTCEVIDGATSAEQTVFTRRQSTTRKALIMTTGIDLLPLAVALLIGIPAFGSCIGIGLATMKFLEGVARQPELASELQSNYFLSVGVTDGAFIIATGIGLWFATANPFAR